MTTLIHMCSPKHHDLSYENNECIPARTIYWTNITVYETPPKFRWNAVTSWQSRKNYTKPLGNARCCKKYPDGLRAHLKKHNYKQLKSDLIFYVKRIGNFFIYIAVTVDDFFIGTNSKKLYTYLFRDLRTIYTVKALGPATKLI